MNVQLFISTCIYMATTRDSIYRGLFNKTAFEVMIPVEQPADRILFLVGRNEREKSKKEKTVRVATPLYFGFA